MTDRARLRLGLIGCGEVTRRVHLPALARIAGIRVTALADVDEKRCRDLADRFRVAGRHATAASLIASDVDAVAVCVPPAGHAALALEILESGRHLFLEKPIALSLRDADRLIERSARARSVSMAGFNLRWHRLAQAAREAVGSGHLGRIRAARAVFTRTAAHPSSHWRGSPAEGGHALLELGVHHFDLLRFLFRAGIEGIRARAVDPDRAEISCTLSNGISAEMFFAATPSSGDTNRIEIEGDRGSLSLSFYRALGWRGSLRSGLPLLPGMLADRWRGGAYRASYRRQWAGFAEACRSGRAGPGATLSDGRAALEGALAAIASAGAKDPDERRGPALAAARAQEVR